MGDRDEDDDDIDELDDEENESVDNDEEEDDEEDDGDDEDEDENEEVKQAAIPQKKGSKRSRDNSGSKSGKKRYGVVKFSALKIVNTIKLQEQEALKRRYVIFLN